MAGVRGRPPSLGSSFRVEAGGHYIPEDDVRRRFDRGWRLFIEVYSDLFDVCDHWFSDDDGLRLLSRHPAA